MSNKEEPTVTLYVANLIRTTVANTLVNIMGGLKISAYYSKEEAESNQIRGHNDALNTAIAKINSFIDQHQPPSNRAELDPDISELLKLAKGDRFGRRLDYYPRDWAILASTEAAPTNHPSGIHRKEVFIDGALLEYGYFGSESNGEITLNCEHWLDKLPPEHSVNVVVTRDIEDSGLEITREEWEAIRKSKGAGETAMRAKLEYIKKEVYLEWREVEKELYQKMASLIDQDSKAESLHAREIYNVLSSVLEDLRLGLEDAEVLNINPSSKAKEN